MNTVYFFFFFSPACFVFTSAIMTVKPLLLPYIFLLFFVSAHRIPVLVSHLYICPSCLFLNSFVFYFIFLLFPFLFLVVCNIATACLVALCEFLLCWVEFHVAHLVHVEMDCRVVWLVNSHPHPQIYSSSPGVGFLGRWSALLLLTKNLIIRLSAGSSLELREQPLILL